MSSTVADAFRAAETIRSPSEYIATIKGLVSRSLALLDSSARIVDTGYFNHTAIPDLVVRWSKNHERLIYLRDSYTTIEVNEDASLLSKHAPVLMAYRHSSESIDQEVRATERISGSVNRQNQTLVTEPSVVDQIAQFRRSSDSPYAAILSDNFLGAAKGLIDESVAETLVQTDDAVDDQQLEQVFTPDVATQITAARRLLEIATNESADIQGLPKLTAEQAGQLLPWLLKTTGIRQDRAFWRHVGENLDLEYLLRYMRKSLAGVELEPLVRSNRDRLLAIRAYLGVGKTDPDAATPRWTLEGGRLVRSTTSSSMVFATNRHLDGGPDLSSATWEALLPALGTFQLRSVSLRGLQRDIHFDTVKSHDLRRDVTQVAASLEDTYFVDSVSLALGSGDEEKRVEVDLDKRLVSVETPASIEELVPVLSRVVSYRNAEVVDELDEPTHMTSRSSVRDE